MNSNELSKLTAALLKAKADGDKAAEDAANAALALAMEVFRETAKTKGMARMKALAERSAAAARNDNV